MLSSRCWTALFCTLVVGSSAVSRAQPIDPAAIPPELKPWTAWVEARDEQRACVSIDGDPDNRRCVWPSELALSLNDRGGSFRLRVHADATQLSELPGEIRRWPHSVRVDGKAAVVLEPSGRPMTELRRGDHVIDGSFTWTALPETLSVPTATALIALDVNGERIAQPRRDEAGQLWLSGGATAEREGEHIELEVFRHIQDGVPLVVTTQISIKASGRAREALLDRVLVPGTIPYLLQADLPARLDSDGKLSLQVRAGTFQVTIVGRTEGSPDRLTLPRATAPWPDQEVWVFAADETLRQARIGGVPGIDPAQTNLSPEWRALPAFLLHADTVLTFETTRRGQPEPPPNQLTLQREMWLDLDGAGYTVRDSLHGELHSGWRLSLPAGQLGHVRGDDGDQLITDLDGQSGVEVRSSNVALTAEWRNETARNAFAAVGWSEDVQSLSAQLHLPPGWSLFTVEGVDHVSNSWLQGWDLFLFFFVLIVALGAGRMFGPLTGAVALVTLVLCHQQDDAPSSVWLVLLAVLGLLRVIPDGQWRNVMRFVLASTLLSFAVVAVPFAITQIRQAIYPQIGGGDSSRYGVGDFTSMMREEDNTVSLDMDEGVMGGAAEDDEGGRGKRRASSAVMALDDSLPASAPPERKAGYAQDAPRKQLQDRDPNAVVQTGPGVPTRAFSTWNLSWTGPVERGAQIQLWLIPPLGNSLLSFLRVALIGLLAFLMLRRSPFGSTPPTNRRVGATAAVASLLVLLASTVAHAQTPSPEILDELEGALFPQPTCAPNCISITRLDLQPKNNELRVVVDAHAGAATIYRLPGPAQTWVPSQVTVDGRNDAALALAETGYLQLRLAPGTHRIELRGPLSSADSITLGLGDQPHHVTATADGWDISGLHEDGSAEESVQLSRSLKTEADGATQNQQNNLPPWLEVTREIDLGVTWHVTTRVTRVSPTGSAVLVRVPLLPGESVTAAELQVESGQALVTLGRDATEVTWTSTLAQSPTLTFTAPSGLPWSEQWVVQCGRVFHCNVEGTPPIRHTSEGQWWPAFRPWPGETLTLTTTQPRGTKGQSSTVDRVTLEVSPGVRMRVSTLDVTLRSSTGELRTLQLPKDARIQNVTLDGERVPIRLHDGQLTVNIARGEHQLRVVWQEPGAMEVASSTPSIGVGGPATNVHLNFIVPDERWLLFVSGPSWGPAILFWGYLLAMLLISLVLAKIPHSPLRAHQWMLLTIGLTQIDTLAQLVIAGWFFALAYRALRPIRGPFFHNVGQLALVGWTGAAFGCLYWALHTGLLFPPDMQVHSSVYGENGLSWYVDRIDGALPTASVVSVSIWVWRGAMLAWALWLAWSLLGWLPWAWRSFTQGGGWKPFAKAVKPPPVSPAPVAAAIPVAAPPTEPAEPGAPGNS